MSLLADLATHQKGLRLPFSRKIVQALLRFDADVITAHPKAGHLVAILAVLFYNLSGQCGLAQRCGVAEDAMMASLKLLCLTTDPQLLQGLLKAMERFQSKVGMNWKQVCQTGVAYDLETALGEPGLARVRQVFVVAHRKSLADLI